jgi:8-oxo-dGTP pyrophosphatase MutT (NUDIX family)
MPLYTKYLKENFIKPQKIKKRRIVGAGIIGKVDDNNKVHILLIQRASEDHYPNFWEFPRGGCQVSDKNSKICAVREIKEETGLDVEIVGYLGKYSYFKDQGVESLCKIYLCKMKDETQPVMLSHEHKDFKWVSTYGEAQLLLNPDQLKFVHPVLNTDGEIITLPDFNLSKTNYQME